MEGYNLRGGLSLAIAVGQDLPFEIHLEPSLRVIGEYSNSTITLSFLQPAFTLSFNSLTLRPHGPVSARSEAALRQFF